jgi:hypothetical protein
VSCTELPQHWQEKILMQINLENWKILLIFVS